jgi:hypothetical protein
VERLALVRLVVDLVSVMLAFLRRGQAVARWATWDREPFAGGDYAVSVHRRRLPPEN